MALERREIPKISISRAVLLQDIAVAILDAAAEDEAVIFRRIGVGTAAFGGGAAECRIDIGTVVDAERDQRRAGKVERAP